MADGGTCPKSPPGRRGNPAVLEASVERVWPQRSPQASLQDPLGSRDRL